MSSLDTHVTKLKERVDTLEDQIVKLTTCIEGLTASVENLYDALHLLQGGSNDDEPNTVSH
jgi:chaperonin cofactor prefoldin